jgi:hypothetical protein
MEFAEIIGAHSHPAFHGVPRLYLQTMCQESPEKPGPLTYQLTD